LNLHHDSYIWLFKKIIGFTFISHVPDSFLHQGRCLLKFCICIDVLAVAQGIIIQYIKIDSIVRVPHAKWNHFCMKRKISEITLHVSLSFIFVSSWLVQLIVTVSKKLYHGMLCTSFYATSCFWENQWSMIELDVIYGEMLDHHKPKLRFTNF